MTESVRIIIADDHPVVRQGLATVLSQEEGFEVVGQAANGLEAVAQARKLRIAARPTNDVLGRVDVDNLSSCCGRSQRAATRVSKQVDDLQRTVGATNPIGNPIPVFRLFGKHANVAERSGSQLKRAGIVLDRPAGR